MLHLFVFSLLTCAPLTSGVSERALHSELVRGWPVEIRACGGDKGFGLFATRAIPAGTVVFEEAPMACVVEARDPPQEEDQEDEEEGQDRDQDQCATGEEQIEEELTDGQVQQSAPTSCAYCRAPLQPPFITDEAAAVPASHSDPATATAAAVSSSAAAWAELQRHPSLLRRLGLDDPSRTPLAAGGATPCRSNAPGHPSHEPAAPPCAESYCGPVCESRAWRRFHAREHMSAEEVARFDSHDMADLLADEHKRTIVSLLLRVTAMLRSRADQTALDSSQQQEQQQQQRLQPQLSVLDHLSHLSSLGTLSHAFTDADLAALERAVAPMLQGAVGDDPELQRRLRAAGASAGKEGAWLLRHLLGALVSNSFRLAHAPPTLLLRRTGSASRSGAEVRHVEVDVVVQAAQYSDVAAAGFSHHAALFSLAAFLNHACMPHSNLAVEMDTSVPLAHPPPAAHPRGQPGSDARSAAEAPSPAARLLPPAGEAPRTRFAAVRDIPQGHELLWTYTLDASTLPARYGFRCTCPACASAPVAVSK